MKQRIMSKTNTSTKLWTVLTSTYYLQAGFSNDPNNVNQTNGVIIV